MRYPLDTFTVSQNFGGNANPYYNGVGLMGHPGMDLVSHYDDLIKASVTAPIYKTLNANNPDPDKYRAVFQLAEINGKTYEIAYGHCNKINKGVGEVNEGDVLGTEGNTGETWVNGQRVTKEQKLAGSKSGTHVHWQMRPVERVKTTEPNKQYLVDENDQIYFDGNYYLVPNFNNGYNGCVDPKKVFEEWLLITKKNLLEKLLELMKRLLLGRIGG